MRKFLIVLLLAAIAFAVGDHLGTRRLRAESALRARFAEALRTGRAGAVADLLEREGVVSRKMMPEALGAAARDGYGEIVKALLAHGADPDAVVENGDIGPSAATALILAARNGRTGAVELLLSGGADPNRTGDCGTSALMAAAENGHLAVMERLIESGARTDMRDCVNASALSYAAYKGSASADAVKLLLNNGAARDEHDLGYSLIRAIDRNDLPVVDALLDRLPDIDAEINLDADGLWTPLARAALAGDARVINAVLARGADPDMKDSSGRTAARYAGSPDAVRILKRPRRTDN